MGKNKKKRTGEQPALGEGMQEKQTDNEVRAPSEAELNALSPDPASATGSPAAIKVPIFESGDELKLGEPTSSEEATISTSPTLTGDPLAISDVRPLSDSELSDAPTGVTSGQLVEDIVPTPDPATAEPAPAAPAAKATSGKRPALGSGKQPVVPAAPKTASGKAPAVTGRAAAVSGRAPAAKITSSRRAAPEPRPVAAPRISSGAMIQIICRECHEEWSIDPLRAKGQETINCPVCEHRAQAPSDDILHQIALYKGIEKKNFTIALGALCVGLFAMFLWTVLTTNPARAENAAVFIGLPVIAFISLIATLAFTSKYENARWETYF